MMMLMLLLLLMMMMRKWHCMGYTLHITEKCKMLLEKNPPKAGEHHGTDVHILFSTFHIISRVCLES